MIFRLFYDVSAIAVEKNGIRRRGFTGGWGFVLVGLEQASYEQLFCMVPLFEKIVCLEDRALLNEGSVICEFSGPVVVNKQTLTTANKGADAKYFVGVNTVTKNMAELSAFVYGLLATLAYFKSLVDVDMEKIVFQVVSDSRMAFLGGVGVNQALSLASGIGSLGVAVQKILNEMVGLGIKHFHFLHIKSHKNDPVRFNVMVDEAASKASSKSWNESILKKPCCQHWDWELVKPARGKLNFSNKQNDQFDEAFKLNGVIELSVPMISRLADTEWRNLLGISKGDYKVYEAVVNARRSSH